MSTCEFEGNADMYGQGIRVGFYLQWLGMIVAAWVAPSEVPHLRLGIAFFITATFLALVIQVLQNNLEPVEIYIVLLLTSGSSLFLIPIVLWRLVTLGNPLYDPTRFPQAKPPGTVFVFFRSILMLGVLSFQLWFWIIYVPELSERYCQEYGFGFVQVRLDNHAFRFFHIIISAVMLLIVLFLMVASLWSKAKNNNNLDRLQERDISRRINFFRALNSAMSFILATAIITATEFCIAWNEIQGVNFITSAGQTIPLFLGIGSVVRIVFVYFTRHEVEDEEE